MDVRGSAAIPSVGPYEIRAALGQGGGGEVYRAWDPRLQREVAVKILRGRHEADSERVRRFVAEARAASALNHPNILAVFDAAVDGDRPYIVSELVDGRSLREEIGRGPVPLRRVLDLATQIADGLAAAHDASIVHRDLKPENILVTRTGRAKIVDFGLARPGGAPFRGSAPVTDAGDDTVTESGLLAGTVPYMSPEQARGAEIDFRSDQFSFGLILCEMVTGRSPFRRDTPAATLDAIINDEPPTLSGPTARLPLLLRWIIERCLAKDPADRYASTADLQRDLRTLRDRTAEALGQESGATDVRSTRRRRIALLVAAIATVIAVSVALLPAVVVDTQPFDPSDLRFTPIATEPAYEGFPAISPDGQTIAYAVEVDGVLQIFTRRLSSAVASQLTFRPFDKKHPFWSPDGKRIYYVSPLKEREGIWWIAAAGGEPQPFLENATRAAISPDGRTVAFMRDQLQAGIVGTAALWISTPPGAELTRDSIEGAKRQYEPLRDLRFTEAAIWFSPDGRSLGLCAVPLSLNLPPEARGWQFWVLPLPEGHPSRRLQSWSQPAPRVSNFAWLDTRHIALSVVSLSTPGADLWVADLEGDRAWPLTRGPDSEYYPTASADGRIVFTRDEGDYDLVEISRDGKSIRPLLATSRNEFEAVWSPVDGSLFAYVTDRRGQDEIWLRSRDGLVRPVVTQEDFGDDPTTLLSSPAISPDGQRVAYQRNGSRPIWPLRIYYSQVAGGPAVELVPSSREGYHGAPTWSPDGQWIAFAEWKDQAWTLVKVRVGSYEPPVALRSGGAPNATPKWSPRDDWITWETADGLYLVSPDGTGERRVSEDQWLQHDWAPDGSRIFAVRESEDDLGLVLEVVDWQTAETRVHTQLGLSPPVNNPVRGLSVGPDGTVVTSVFRLRGDLYLVEGLQFKRHWLRSFWPLRSP